jgi:ABC-type transporter Mla maintaining outer membrane lipid asymmetry ATPase subunit MlaF
MAGVINDLIREIDRNGATAITITHDMTVRLLLTK